MLYIGFLSLLCGTLTAQMRPYATEGISSVDIAPYFVRDSSGEMGIKQMTAGKYDPYLIRAESPYLSFGDAPTPWWQTFQLVHNEEQDKTFILWLRRRNVDSIQVWHKFPNDSVVFLGNFGVSAHDSERFSLNNGYHTALTLQKGTNQIYIRALNKLGTAYMGYQVMTPTSFKVQSRYYVIFFGLFMGVAFISLLFCVLMFSTYSDWAYFFYALYVVSIVMRECFNYAVGPDLGSSMQRHGITLFLGASLGLFLRFFLRIWEYSKSFDTFIKYYSTSFYFAIPAYALVVGEEQQAVSKLFLQVILVALLFNNVLIVTFAIVQFRKIVHARVVLLAYFPLACFTFLNVMRNMNLIPNYPILQHGMIFGFILEIAIFTFAFVQFYRSMKSTQSDLEDQLEQEEKSRPLDVKDAESRVKEEIARDLHDDIAASVSSIRILSKIAKDQAQRENTGIVPLFEQINRNAQHTLDNIGDLIWTLRTHPEPLTDLADRITTYTVGLLENQDIQYDIRMPSEMPHLDLDLNTRRNLLVVFKEALNNAVTHSKCSHIQIALSLQSGQLILRVQDNGEGFDTQSKPVGIGQGIAKMRARAQDIGAALDIYAAPQEGTSVVLYVPVM
jgi:signal transduction histidine kinase